MPDTKRTRGRPSTGRTIRLGSVRMTPETATKGESLALPGENLSDTFARLVKDAAPSAGLGAAG